jgi:3-oxoacyl-[acyl-carrier protein] reductase
VAEGRGRALVTGASRGIGRAVALRLARAGFRVAVSGRTAGSAGPTAEAIREAGGEAVPLGADLAVYAEAERLVEEAVKALGGLDLLVNNAGLTKDTLVLRMSEADWDAVLDANLKGAFACAKAAIKAMLRTGGRVVNVTSVVGVMGNPGQANYVASKAGLIGLTKALAREYAGRGILVNAVAPGFIETDMTRALPDKVKEDLLRQIPLGRFGQAEDVAGAVAFLAGPDAAYVTGQVIHVNGGMYM